MNDPSREEIIEAGYRSMCASSDLHHVGYTVRIWMRLTDGAILLEYLPRNPHGRNYGRARRVMKTYAEQVALHRELGLGVVGPGENWDRRDRGQPGLFDSLVTV